MPYQVSCCTGEGRQLGIAQRLELVADCQAVICLKAGQCVQELAKEKGIMIFEMNGTVSFVLQEYVRYMERGINENERSSL